MIAVAGGEDRRLPDRIGVALSAGSTAAMAQIGALEVLSASRIPIDCVAGTSAGALVGAALAAGRLAGLRDRLECVTPRRIVGLFDPVWPRAGLIEGLRGLDWIRPFLGDTIERLSLDFSAVATDLHTGEEVRITRGPVVDAVRASIAFPGVFTPWLVEDRLLVDGGLVDPLPIAATRGLGADFVIAINVLPLRERTKAGREATNRHLRLVSPIESEQRKRPAPPQSPGLASVLARSSRIMASELASRAVREEPPDYLIQIPVPDDVGMFDLHRSAELVECGRRAAFSALSELRRILDQTSPIVGLDRTVAFPTEAALRPLDA